MLPFNPSSVSLSQIQSAAFIELQLNCWGLSPAGGSFPLPLPTPPSIRFCLLGHCFVLDLQLSNWQTSSTSPCFPLLFPVIMPFVPCTLLQHFPTPLCPPQRLVTRCQLLPPATTHIRMLQGSVSSVPHINCFWHAPLAFIARIVLAWHSTHLVIPLCSFASPLHLLLRLTAVCVISVGHATFH